ncbi:MAG: formate--tetrahydrofolate ligase [Nitrosomonas sp.]|nr:formate--tetrahydrofolate ligase [Nitrosomonas sp.]
MPQFWPLPNAVVLVITVRALKTHGGGDAIHSGAVTEIERGLEHLGHHIRSVRAWF